MNKDINNIQKLYEANQEQSITVKDQKEIPKGYTGHVLFTNGRQEWRKNGLIHRDDGPSSIDPNGVTAWHKNGKLHREDGPAHIENDGKLAWYKDDKLHREDGPAVINPIKGTQYWFLNGKNYPKEEFDMRINKSTGRYINDFNGVQYWYKDGLLHREDGPAEIWPNGYLYWYLNDICYSREDYYRELHKRGVISDEDLFAELL